MLRSLIVDALADHADVELLGLDSPEWSEGRDVDVILAGAADPHDVEHARRLLTAWPKSRILIVSGSGRDVVMYEWYPQKLVLGDVSPRTLVNVIRRGFDQPC